MAYPISDVTRRVVYSGSAGVGPYSFSFEILNQTDIAVYKNSTLLTLTTNYTVTINTNGTGSITLVSAATGADNITIVGDRGIQRTTDFVTGGDLFANTLNQELDALTIYSQQVDEKAERGLKAPVTDPTDIAMTLPAKASRAGKTLAFDANGNPVVGEDIGNWRGNWAAGTAYTVRDLVKDGSNSNVYRCNTAHTSTGSTPISSNADSAKWDLVVDAAAADASADAAAASEAAAAASASLANDWATKTSGPVAGGEYSAKYHAQAASTSASNASSSASTASTQASNAATSASNASSSATAAAGSASTASTQATNASNSASAAATSATNASNSASAASTSASNAASSASAASTSASNASTSASNAASSASSASTSAGTATTQATNASNSASAAATSATNASNSASAAATSATDAAASAAAAATALDNFDDRYLGAKSSDPTVDNDGNPLLTGALYYRTTAPAGMKVYDGAQWLAASSAMQAALVTYEYVATSGQTTFSGADVNSVTLSYIAGGLIVSRNGVILRPGDEYTATNGTSIVLAVGAAAGDEINAFAFASFNVANTYTQAQTDALLANKQAADADLTDLATNGAGTGNSQYVKRDASARIPIGANWSVFESAGVLYFRSGSTNYAKLDASGNLTVAGNVTAYGTV